jgi:eukaryotic-like serine/threonine-protein kinase
METKLRLGKRYQLLERIGKGGMGVVYRAKDRLSGEEVALKSLLLDQTMAGSEFQSLNQRVQLANEFKWLASLRHPNIVSVIDYGFDLMGHPFFTMELLHGYTNIVEACSKKPLHQRLSILGYVLHALAYLHRRNVIHRDLKNTNVLVKDGQVKLLDFGLVTLRGQEIDKNFVVGTLTYMPPEAITGASPTMSGDLYSFGVLAYYALTGRLPFENSNNNELIQAILHNPVNFSDFILPDDLRMTLERLLAKNPDLRYESAHEVITVLNRAGASIPIETQQIRESFLRAAAFIGRKTELVKLKMALVETSNSEGSSWLVAGETGIGKSRLIQELRTYALTRGCLILEGEASSQSREPFGLWRNILRRLLLELSLDKREHALVESLLKGTEKPLENIPERLGNLLVKQFSGQESVLLILEDIHWADEPSLELLRQLLSRVKPLPLMLVASYRSDDAPRLGKDLNVTASISLERFTLDEIEELTKAILGQIDKRLTKLLIQETEGNLFFLVEVLRTLAEQAGTLNDIGNIEWQSRILTGGIRGIIDNRLKHLPSKHINTLEIAALVGRRVDVRLLARVTNELEAFLQAGEGAAIFEVHNNEWHFSHNKLREIIEDYILPVHKRELHQRILLELEKLYGKEAAAQLVYHAHEARDKRRELRYAIVAADDAFKVFSLKDAIRYYQRAIALSSQRKIDTKELSRLYQQLGRAFELSNQYLNAEQAYQEEYDLGLSQSLENLELNALTNLACLYSSPNPLFSHQNGRQFITKGLILAERLRNKLEQARLYWASMVSNIYSDGNTLRAVDDGLRSLRLAQDVGDVRILAFTLHDLSRAYLFEADFERGRALMERACTFWQELDHLPMLADGYGNLSILHTFMGNYENALVLSKKAYNLANEINSGWGRSVALSYVGTIYMEQGHLSLAIETMQECLNNSEIVGNHLPLVLTRSELALAHLRQGNYLNALEAARLALEVANNHIHYHMLELSPKSVLAYTHLMMGDLEEARSVVDSISPPEFSFMMSPSALRLIAETRSQLAMLNLEFDRAFKIAEAFLDVSERLELGSQLPLAHSLMARILGSMNQESEALAHRAKSQESTARLKIPLARLW